MERTKRQRRPRLCVGEASVCGLTSTSTKRPRASSGLRDSTLRILKDQGAVASVPEQRRFVECIGDSIKYKKDVRRSWSGQECSDDDIISLIKQARDDGDLDEAVWRAFLAAHFGRSSADPDAPNQTESAGKLLCAFGNEPQWTWDRVSARPAVLRTWLMKHAADLRTLAFGNHRKYESQKPKILWKVINSFLHLAAESGGPAALFSIEGDDQDPAERFDALYRRLRPLQQFGRTGRFDFLELLIDLDLLDAEPGRCYLAGATGPKRGAVLLWGDYPPRSLDDLAAELVDGLTLSAQIIEDALCNWQKWM